jgi:Ca2+-binding RTX toxin-like protein
MVNVVNANLSSDLVFQPLYTSITGTIYGDLLYGTGYADWISGLTGNDELYGGAGGDDVIVAGPESPVAGFSDNDVVYGDTFRGGSTNDVIYGGYGDDILYGDSYEGGGGGNDIIYGGLGNDQLVGGDGNDNLDGGFGNDLLAGGAGNDRLNGYGTTVTNDSQFDRLIGGRGSDKFVLGETGKVFYNETGDGYAVIQGWDPMFVSPTALDLEFDRIQAAGNARKYKLTFSSVGGIGTNAQDTSIFYKVNNSWERIGIVEDSINVKISRDFTFV